MTYTFKLMERDWYKRRQPIKNSIQVKSIDVEGFEKQHNHMCKIRVIYSDDKQKTLIARVIFNHLTKQWTVDGMDLAVVLVED